MPLVLTTTCSKFRLGDTTREHRGARAGWAFRLILLPRYIFCRSAGNHGYARAMLRSYSGGLPLQREQPFGRRCPADGQFWLILALQTGSFRALSPSPYSELLRTQGAKPRLGCHPTSSQRWRHVQRARDPVVEINVVLVLNRFAMSAGL